MMIITHTHTHKRVSAVNTETERLLNSTEQKHRGRLGTAVYERHQRRTYVPLMCRIILHALKTNTKHKSGACRDTDGNKVIVLCHHEIWTPKYDFCLFSAQVSSSQYRAGGLKLFWKAIQSSFDLSVYCSVILLWLYSTFHATCAALKKWGCRFDERANK